MAGVADDGETTSVELTRNELFYLADELNHRIGDDQTPTDHPSAAWRAQLLTKLLDAHARFSLEPWSTVRLAPPLPPRRGESRPI